MGGLQLDQGIGCCWLRNPSLAALVGKSFEHMLGEKFEMDVFVVMPNHVHVLLRPYAEFTLEKIIKSLKGYTAYVINKRIGRSGNLWMEDYWDRMIRSESHFLRVRNYIMNNPRKAKLKEGEYLLWKTKN